MWLLWVLVGVCLGLLVAGGWQFDRREVFEAHVADALRLSGRRVP